MHFVLPVISIKGRVNKNGDNNSMAMVNIIGENLRILINLTGLDFQEKINRWIIFHLVINWMGKSKAIIFFSFS
jgi:hypothetical protein